MNTNLYYTTDIPPTVDRYSTNNTPCIGQVSTGILARYWLAYWLTCTLQNFNADCLIILLLGQQVLTFSLLEFSLNNSPSFHNLRKLLQLLVLLKKQHKKEHTFCSTSEYPSWRLISHVVSSRLKNLTKSLRLSANIRKQFHFMAKKITYFNIDV